ncbi:MAG: hypothetical protein IT531_25350 [Burkholderiales bacterium]|nr:hypothetical protein [Burkholderiales bacterium]
MITIRKEQVAAFKQAAEAQFERGLLAGLAVQFPRLRELHCDGALDETVRLGIERARQHDLQASADVQRYLWLMLLFGSHWERDPQVGWAAAALAAEDPPRASERIGRVWEQAETWRSRVMGPNDSLYVAALHSLDGRSVEDLCKNPSRSQRDLLIQLAAMFPRKVAELGDDALYDLTRLAVEACKPFELIDRWAVVLMTELMFLFGAGFLVDPLHPWAREALQASAGRGIDQRLEALLSAAQRRVALYAS